MPWIKSPVGISTPCGDFFPLIPAPDIPGLPAFPPPLPSFPPKFSLPLPNCSLLKHLGSAPEPPEDSFP